MVPSSHFLVGGVFKVGSSTLHINYITKRSNQFLRENNKVEIWERVFIYPTYLGETQEPSVNGAKFTFWGRVVQGSSTLHKEKNQIFLSEINEVEIWKRVLEINTPRETLRP